MSFFGSESTDEISYDARVGPEQIVLDRIKKKVKEVNDSITHLNDHNGSNLPTIDSIPQFEQVKAIDIKFAQMYEQLSEERPESLVERRRVIDARQNSQELLGIYMTYYSVSEPVET